MKDLFEKLCLLMGEILCYSDRVAWISKPVIDSEEDYIYFNVKDIQNNPLTISIPFSSLNKAHDHTLDTLVLEIMRKEKLL